MEATIDIEFLQGRDERVIKEVAIISDDVLQSFLFLAPYPMDPHGSKESGLNWSDGQIPYERLPKVRSEVVAPYDHLYARGYEKCELLHDILQRPIHNYEDLQCTDPKELKSNVHCYLSCHAFTDMQCEARNAYAQHCWLKYHLQSKSYIKCPNNFGRHTAQFASGVPKNNAVVMSLLFFQPYLSFCLW
jgi:hypothetical protein